MPTAAVPIALMAALALAGAAGPSNRSGAPLLHHAQAAAPAPDERARHIDDLFRQLHAARDQESADPIVAGIWQAWMRTGRPDIDMQMAQAVNAVGMGTPELALPILDQVVGIAPSYAEGWNQRATVLYLLGRHEQSLADIEKVLALEPRHFGALAGRGMIAIAAGRWKDALAAYRAALAANPFLRERHEIIPALVKRVEGEPT